MVAAMALVSTYELPPRPEKSDSLPGRGSKYDIGETIVETRTESKGIGREEKVEIEKVATGTSTVPFFPKTLSVPGTTSSTSPALPAGIGDGDETYQLVGLGIRTVSFLSIQVYVVGLYIATSDIATLQARLVREVAGTESASALVAGERDDLRQKLLHATEGLRIWDSVIREGKLRTVLRIVPTRNTDFAHLRDGWVRGMTGRSQGLPKGEGLSEKFEDEQFEHAMAEFKKIFGGAGRKSIAKGKVLMLERTADGTLAAWLERDKSQGFDKLGEVSDERISRLLWLGYLAGKTVASEEARKNMVEGVVGYVERPVGTVETQLEMKFI